MVRFAFYGRVSTEDQQDPAASRNWQLTRARSLIDGHGAVVEEFFDIGMSRSIPWKRRPEAARLLGAVKATDRTFDAIVLGEPQRAFYGNQYGLTYPVLQHFGVGLWVPEVGGAIDPDSEAHDRDGGAGADRGPVPGRPPTVRVPTGRCRAAPEPGEGG